MNYTHKFKSQGHWNVSNGSKTIVTTDSRAIDEINDLKADDASDEQIQACYDEHFKFEFES